jgi:hypothetical protein
LHGRVTVDHFGGVGREEGADGAFEHRQGGPVLCEEQYFDAWLGAIKFAEEFGAAFPFRVAGEGAKSGEESC